MEQLSVYDKLKDNRSIPIQNIIKTFIFDEFPKLATQIDKKALGQKFQNFITKLITNFCQIWKIKLTYQSENLYHELCDNFETLLTKKLYNKIFCSTRSEKEEDFFFDHLLEQYQFITPKFLDIDENVIDDLYFSAAINKLSMINQYKSPKDKMLTFINVVSILSIMYSKFSKKETSPGAEEVFPLLVFTVIKGKIPKLKSNLNYYTLFRHASRIESQEDYYLQTLSAVIKFIDNLSSENLNVTKEEFNSKLKLYKEQQNEKMKKYINPFSRNQDEVLILKYLKGKEEDITKANTQFRHNHIFSIDFNKIYNDYYSVDFDTFTPEKMDEMLNDFKAVLKLTDSFIQNGTVPSKNKDNITSDNNSTLINI